MNEDLRIVFEREGGEFISPPSSFEGKLRKVKAILLDWDGVFNDGFKRAEEGSLFSEVDAMGTNLLRYTYWKRLGALPVVAVMTGENNPAAVALAKREHFHNVYSQARNKPAAFDKFCSTYGVSPEEVLFFFDDVLDLEVARRCGSRIMIGRSAAPLLKDFAKRFQIADYITAHDGGGHGLREGCELTMGMLGLFDHVVQNRMTYSEEYQAYLEAKMKVELSLA